MTNFINISLVIGYLIAALGLIALPLMAVWQFITQPDDAMTKWIKR